MARTAKKTTDKPTATPFIKAKASDKPEPEGNPEPETEGKPEPSFVVPMQNVSTKVLGMGKVTNLSGAYNTWHVDIAAGVAVEDILNPAYWKHYARNVIRTGDKIEARCEDGTWEATARVMYVGNGEIKLAKLTYHEHGEVEVSDDAGSNYRVRFIPGIGWGVMNTQSKEWLTRGLAQKELAHAFLAKHLKKVG